MRAAVWSRHLFTCSVYCFLLFCVSRGSASIPLRTALFYDLMGSFYTDHLKHVTPSLPGARPRTAASCCLCDRCESLGWALLHMAPQRPHHGLSPHFDGSLLCLPPASSTPISHCRSFLSAAAPKEPSPLQLLTTQKSLPGPHLPTQLASHGVLATHPLSPSPCSRCLSHQECQHLIPSLLAGGGGGMGKDHNVLSTYYSDGTVTRYVLNTVQACECARTISAELLKPAEGPSRQ